MIRDTGIIKLYRSWREMRYSTVYHCYFCSSEILYGQDHRTDLAGRKKCCEQCAGFFLSRYSFTFHIPDPTKSELAVEKMFNEEIADRLVVPISAQGLSTGKNALQPPKNIELPIDLHKVSTA